MLICVAAEGWNYPLLDWLWQGLFHGLPREQAGCQFGLMNLDDICWKGRIKRFKQGQVHIPFASKAVTKVRVTRVSKALACAWRTVDVIFCSFVSLRLLSRVPIRVTLAGEGCQGAPHAIPEALIRILVRSVLSRLPFCTDVKSLKRLNSDVASDGRFVVERYPTGVRSSSVAVFRDPLERLEAAYAEWAACEGTNGGAEMDSVVRGLVGLAGLDPGTTLSQVRHFYIIPRCYHTQHIGGVFEKTRARYHEASLSARQVTIRVNKVTIRVNKVTIRAK
eukprot:7554199-Pyramimonas_sp.AAC.1